MVAAELHGLAGGAAILAELLVLYGLICGLLFLLYGWLNKRHVRKYEALKQALRDEVAATGEELSEPRYD
jgi:hypothetical protein